MRWRSGASQSERCAVGSGRRWLSDDLAEKTKRCAVGWQIAQATEPPLEHQRVDPASQASEDLGPLQLGERIGQFLRGFGVVQGGEGIVLEVEPQPPFEHLPGQGGVAIDVDLDREREPGRQADVDQAQLRVEEVGVQDALLPPRIDQARSALAGGQPEAGAALHAAEDDDQALDQVGSLSQDLVDQLVLAMGPLKEAVVAAGFLGHLLGVVDDGVGLFLGEGHEVAPPDLEDVVAEAFEGRAVGEGQMAREEDAIEAGEHGDDQAGKLGDEARQRLHGVLRWSGASREPHSAVRTPSLPALTGRGSALSGRTLDRWAPDPWDPWDPWLNLIDCS